MINTFDELKEYLDNAIRSWREKRDGSTESGAQFGRQICECYVDAYQSVRKSVFDELLD